MGPICHTMVFRQVLQYLTEIGIYLPKQDVLTSAYRSMIPDLERTGSTTADLNRLINVLLVVNIKSDEGINDIAKVSHIIADLFFHSIMVSKYVEVVFEPAAELVSKKDAWTEKIITSNSTNYDSYDSLLRFHIDTFKSKYIYLSKNPLSTVIFRKPQFNNMVRESIRSAREFTVDIVRISQISRKG